MTNQAPSPTRWLRNHVWRIPLQIPKLWLWAHVHPRIVHVNRLTTYWFSLLFLHVAQEFYMTKCNSYRDGEIDSPFSQRNQRAYCVSTCEVQILMQHRSRFLYFLQEYKLFMRSLEASRETLSMNTEKASSWDFSTSGSPEKSQGYCTKPTFTVEPSSARQENAVSLAGQWWPAYLDIWILCPLIN